jgi:hypothetical protein
MTHEKKTTRSMVQDSLRLAGGVRDCRNREIAAARYEQALSLLPEEVLDSFLAGRYAVRIIVMPDPQLPMGMSIKVEDSGNKRRYTIFVYEEQCGWPEDRFLGALLRELGHVVAGKPPEHRWPQARGERARFKEMLECKADALVWQWGLRHYSMSHLNATYPPHWVDRIVKQISEYMDSGEWHEVQR